MFKKSSIVVLVAGLLSLSGAENLDTYARVSYDGYAGLGGEDANTSLLWAYISLPGFNKKNISFFPALEIEFMEKNIYRDDALLHEGPLGRIGVPLGFTLINKTHHRGVVILGPGIATASSDVSSDIFYMHVIYEHRFFISKTFEWGLGIALSFNNGYVKDPPVNLLPYLRWNLTPRLAIRANWDNVHITTQLTDRASLFAQVRYDMSFFLLRENWRYQFENVSAGAGGEFQLLKHWFMSADLRYLLYRNERVYNKGTEYSTRTGSGGVAASISAKYKK